MYGTYETDKYSPERELNKDIQMIFFATYECFPEKREQAQSFFANMTADQIANEAPSNVTLLARYHDVPNGTGITIVETDDQEAMTAWTLGWATMCHFPIIKPMLDDNAARALIKKMEAAAG